MRSGCIMDTLTIVDFSEIIKIGGKVFENYEGIIYQENVKESSNNHQIIIKCHQNLKKKFASRQEYKNEKKNKLMQKLVNKFLNSLYGVHYRKSINGSYKCESQNWRQNTIIKY